MLHPKKVGTLPVEGRDEEKQTNEIKTAIPLLDTIDIQGKTITADALLTQRELARYLVEKRSAHYHFTVKANQKQLLEETAFYFDQLERAPDHSTLDSPEHGRIETVPAHAGSRRSPNRRWPYSRVPRTARPRWRWPKPLAGGDAGLGRGADR